MGAAPPVAATPADTPAGTPVRACLVKEYLQAGVVLFKDVCGNTLAINTTSNPKATESACLVKIDLQDGVLFRDLCTSEWAMNPPPAQQAQTGEAPAQQTQ